MTGGTSAGPRWELTLARLRSQILSTSDQIDPDTLALSNQPRGGENLVKDISGDLQSLGIGCGLLSRPLGTVSNARASH